MQTVTVPTGQESKSMQIPVLSTNEAIMKLQNNLIKSAHHHAYRAMYSSIVEGIIMDPILMSIPVDDHMVHRGHGVFDTASIVNGCLYLLDSHIERFLRSAAMAKISHTYTHHSLREILIQTVAASNCREGSLRYWLSAGPGNFKLSSKACKQASFYAMVIEGSNFTEANRRGTKIITSSIPMKPPQLATMKNVNYLQNVFSKMEAEEHGAYVGIWVDDKGFVAEGPHLNVAFVSHNGVLLVPPFDNILSGCTVKRMLALAPQLLLSKEHKAVEDTDINGSQNIGRLKGIKVGPIPVTDAKDAAEMMLLGSGVPIKPVLEWDGKPIGDGQPGPVTLALRDLVLHDAFSGAATERIPVQYKDQQNGNA